MQFQAAGTLEENAWRCATSRERGDVRRRTAENEARSQQPNQAWSLDFVADQLADGRRFRALTIVDVFTRESLAIEAGQSLKGADVVRVLSRICLKRATPKTLFCDNGSEFTSQAMDLWAYHAGVQIDFSRPGKPTDNAYVESFNGTLRSECLDAHWFASLAEARAGDRSLASENTMRVVLTGRWARGRRTKSPMSSRLAANSLGTNCRKLTLRVIQEKGTDQGAGQKVLYVSTKGSQTFS